MKFTDIVDLAKQGYTPKDIKELLSLNVSDGSEDIPPEEDHHEEGQADELIDQKCDATPEDDAGLDYKSLYEESQKELEKIKNDLKKAQKDNTKENMGDPNKPSDNDILNDIVRSFM